MRVVFNGILAETEGGCSACGAKKKSKYSFVHSKLYHLPSGKQITFRVGVPVDVSEEDGRFLLGYNYVDQNGTQRRVFDHADADKVVG